ncbi:MAG: ribbon-helix-helix domain-containing protein [Chloroflexota bacterium]
MALRPDPARHALAETAAAYRAGPAQSSHSKLSITLPDPLLEQVRAAAAATGSSVSAVIAAALRSEIDRAEQARLDAAIELQNEENAAWSAGILPSTARIWSEVEW